jgi:hypothetical protein
MPEKTRTKESPSRADGAKKEKANTHKLALKGEWFSCDGQMLELTVGVGSSKMVAEFVSEFTGLDLRI